MEVKIKDGNGYVEADWTIEEGVMVVSPKKAKFEPKNGDVVVCDDEGIQIFICKKSLGDFIYSYCMYDIEDNDLTFFENISYEINRPATEEEKKKLFDKLAEEGYEWDAEKRKLVKIKWKPKVGDKFYYPNYKNRMFVPVWYMHSDKFSLDNDSDIQQWYVFKTNEDCQEFCDKLNQAISLVKPKKQ